VAYIEGTNAVTPGDPIGLRINGKRRGEAVVRAASRFVLQIEAREGVIEIDIRPVNEATWDRARDYIATQAGVPVAGVPG
jgi:hypothetical protein